MKKIKNSIRAMAAMVFILAMMLSMASCGGSNTAADEPDGTDPPTASVSPGVTTPEPSGTVQPGTPVKTTTNGKTSGSTKMTTSRFHAA